MLIAKMAADQKDKYVLAFGNIRQTLNEHSRNDYSQGNFPEYLQGFMRIPNPQVVVQRLLKAGYVAQSQNSFTVPNVSGDYHAELSYLYMGYHMNAKYALTISMKPTDNSISGHYHEESTGGGAQSADGPLSGTVDANRTVHLIYGNQYGGARLDYTFKSTNGEESLTGKQPFINGPNVTLVGHGTGEKSECIREILHVCCLSRKPCGLVSCPCSISNPNSAMDPRVVNASKKHSQKH